MSKYELYKQLIKDQQDFHGFIESNKCDSLLFSGLVGCVPGVSVDIYAAFEPNTKTWHRRDYTKSCYPDHSDSSISRDMLVGLAWYCYVNKRHDIAEEVVKYALSHWGIMGEAKDLKTLVSRCFIGPGLLSTFARISGKYKWLWWLPMDLPGAPVLEGFQAHLQVLHKLLRHKLKGTDPSKDKILQAQVKRQYKNPLFHAAVGNKNIAMTLLSDTRYWPEDRLPTSQDRHEPWLVQRDFGADWLPAEGNHVHSGGDYLFVMALCKKEI